MEKTGKRTRDIQFYSEKNQRTICVHSKQARSYTKYLEKQSWVSFYETSKPLEQDRFVHISHAGLQKELFQIEWVSDFYVIHADESVCVLEMASPDDLKKRSVIQRLELSRRYWSLFDVEWKVLLMTNPEKTGKKGEIS